MQVLMLRDFPALNVVGSLKAQRLLTAANFELLDQVETISRELWMKVWSIVNMFTQLLADYISRIRGWDFSCGLHIDCLFHIKNHYTTNF